MTLNSYPVIPNSYKLELYPVGIGTVKVFPIIVFDAVGNKPKVASETLDSKILPLDVGKAITTT